MLVESSHFYDDMDPLFSLVSFFSSSGNQPAVYSILRWIIYNILYLCLCHSHCPKCLS